MVFNFNATKKYIFLILLFFICESLTLKASEILSEKIKSFEIKPQLCIVTKLGDICYLKSEVTWRSQETLDLCLSIENTILQCWNQQKFNQENFVFELNQATKVFLLDKNKTKLAVALLNVNSMTHKKQRRRLRSAWSIF